MKRRFDSFIVPVLAGMLMGTFFFSAIVLSGCGQGSLGGASDTSGPGEGEDAPPSGGDGSVPVKLTSIKQISSYGFNTCALSWSNKVYCWGSTSLGSGRWPHAGNVKSLSGKAVSSISVGGAFACALMADGTLECWGNFPSREPQISTASLFSIAQKIEGVSGVTKIFALNGSICYLVASTAQYCWGRGDTGELGDGNRTSSATPVQTLNLYGTKVISSWNTASTIVGLDSNGRLKWWGSGSPTLMDPEHYTISLSPASFSQISSVGNLDVAVGSGHACLIDSNRAVKCWGKNSYGELGNGSTTDSWNLVQATGLTAAFKQVVAGYNFVCALDNLRRVFCWGRNEKGVLGDGTATDSLTPKRVTALDSFSVDQIVANNYSICALSVAGEIKCWGWLTTGTSPLPIDIMEHSY